MTALRPPSGDQIPVSSSRSEPATVPREGPAPPTGRSRLRPLINVGVVVAVLGLLFTVATYWVDQRSQSREDQRQARAALTAVTGQLTALYRAYAPQLAEMSGPALVDAYSSLNTETVVLVAQAEQLASENPSMVRASDRYAIGDAHLRLGNFDRSYESYARADQMSSSDSSDYGLAIASRRGMAASLFGLERADEARVLLERVVASEGFDDLAQTVQVSNAHFTLMFWTRTEAAFGYCAESAKLIERLTSLALERGSNSDVETIAALSESVSAVCG